MATPATGNNGSNTPPRQKNREADHLTVDCVEISSHNHDEPNTPQILGVDIALLSESALQALQPESQIPEPRDGSPAPMDSLATLHNIEHPTSQAVVLHDVFTFEDISEQRPAVLRATADLFSKRFEQSSRREDLDISIKLMSKAVELTLDNDPDKAGYQSRLGVSYWKRYERLGDLADLCRAIEFHEQALSHTPCDHLRKHEHLSNLGVSYQSLYERLGRLDDLYKSIGYKEQAILLTPDNHPRKPVLLGNLGASFDALFKRLGRLDDLHKSVNSLEQAVLLTPDDRSHELALLSNLGVTYQSLFDRLGRLDDLHKSIGCKEQVVMLAPDNHAAKPELLSNLGNSYHALFKRLGRLDDIHKAIMYRGQAVALAPDDHPHRPVLLENLGIAHQTLFDRLGGLDDLYKSIMYQEQAASLTPDDYPGKPRQLNGLGIAYHSIFYRLGRLDDVQKSVSYKEQAVILTQDSHPDKPGYLNDLGISYQSVFERLGQLDYLDKSINCLEQALMLTPEGHPRKPIRLNTLGNSHQSLFMHLRREDDIRKSVSCLEQAVSLTPDDHFNKPGHLNDLGIAYLGLFDCLNQLDSLEKSVGCLEQAVILTPDGHPEKPMFLINLGSAQLSLFEFLGRPDHAQKSIDCKEQAVKLTPDGHPSKPGLLNNLGHSYRILFERQGSLQDADQAAGYLKQAVHLSVDGHPMKVIVLSELGKLYAALFARSRVHEHGLAALNFFKLAALTQTGYPSQRFQSTRLWALLSRRLDSSPLEAYTYCMTLLPQVAWLGISVRHRYERIAKECGTKEFGNLVAEAATAAISREKYDLALEWLEEGRSIVWAQMLQLRTPYDELYAVHPEMAEELQWVSYQLEHAATSQPLERTSTSGGRSLHETAWEQRRLAQRREEILDSARLLPGLEGFLRPPCAHELINLVQDGVVVVVNVHAYRCDALVIRANTQEITHVPLIGFSFGKAEHARAKLARCLRGQGSGRGFKTGNAPTKPTFKEILAMLWSDVAKPVLNHLNITYATSADDLPHITWCTTGPLAFLPLHAAGDYGNPSTVLPNLVISSYTPTIGSLRQHTSSPGPFSGILAVGHESPIRGFDALPGTKAELDQVQMQANRLPFTRLDEEDARTDTVLKAMGDHSWVHFACHASQNLVDPMKSAFHLHDKDLDLETISRHPLKNAQLAFLSACQTATGDAALPDESVHLAAGLLMAGYPSVIATMWSICDQDAPLVAGKVYECLIEGGEPNSRNAAKALHKAVASLRGVVGEGNFARWVPYVHIGR